MTKTKRLVLAAALAAIGGAAYAQPGYVTQPGGGLVTSPFGLCWRSGDWTPDKAVEPCDRVPSAAAPESAAGPEPAPLAAAPAAPSLLLEKVTLASDVLFDFNKATLKEAGRQKLDEMAARIKDADVEQVVAVGHADRIASEEYNQRLSEERAEAVKSYLAGKGLPGDRVRVEGKGEAQPVTAGECRNMGPERGSNAKLVACLQPDRRVEIEVLGTREAAAGPAGGAAGATSPGAGSGPGR